MEPKIRKITTQKGTVFNSLQDYRQAAAKIGQPIDDMSDEDIVREFGSGNNPAIKIEYEPTAPPPMSSLVAKSLREKGKAASGAFSDFIYPAAEAITGLVKGTGSSIMSVPSSVMRIAGFDPSKVEVPSSYSFGGQVSGVPVGGAPAPILNTPLQKKPEAQKQEPLTFGKLERELEPKTGPEQTGRFLMDLYGFGKAKSGATAIGTVAKAKMPATVASILETPAVKTALDKAANFGLYMLQEYGQTGDKEKAAEAAVTGSLIDLGLSSLGAGAKSLYKKYGKDKVEQIAEWAAKRSLPIIEQAKGGAKDFLDYHRDLAKRLLKTGSQFSEDGVKSIQDRFTKTVEAMKGASDKSDELLKELNRLQIIPEDALRQVDYGSEVTKALSGLKNRQIDQGVINRIEAVESRINALLPKKPKLDASGNPIPIKAVGASGKPIPILDPSTGKQAVDASGNPLFEQAIGKDGKPAFELSDELENLTFKEAEELKEKINGTLKSFYDTAILSPEDNVDKRIKLEYGDALRRAQKAAFEKLENLKNTVYKFIPANSPAKEMKPWEISVPGESGRLRYEQVAQLAKQDADLAKIGWEARIALEPQAAKTSFNEMAAAIGLAQFTHGSLFTPSQVATTWKVWQRPDRMSKLAHMAKRSVDDLRQAIPASVRPVTQIPPYLFGQAAILQGREPSPDQGNTGITPSMGAMLEDFSTPLSK